LTRHKNIFILSILILNSCDFVHKDNGLFGHSSTKEEAAANGSQVLIYVPDKYSFSLLDKTTLFIDTAWTEESFSYHNGKRIIDASNGYHFSIPIIKKVPDSFTFMLSLADTHNQAFTNGGGEKLIQLCPQTLYKEIKVLLEQKDPDTSKGWTNPIVLDTITFRLLE
jgi:hypothetical protein